MIWQFSMPRMRGGIKVCAVNSGQSGDNTVLATPCDAIGIVGKGD